MNESDGRAGLTSQVVYSLGAEISFNLASLEEGVCSSQKRPRSCY